MCKGRRPWCKGAHRRTQLRHLHQLFFGLKKMAPRTNPHNSLNILSKERQCDLRQKAPNSIDGQRFVPEPTREAPPNPLAGPAPPCPPPLGSNIDLGYRPFGHCWFSIFFLLLKNCERPCLAIK